MNAHNNGFFQEVSRSGNQMTLDNGVVVRLNRDGQSGTGSDGKEYTAKYDINSNLLGWGVHIYD